MFKIIQTDWIDFSIIHKYSQGAFAPFAKCNCKVREDFKLFFPSDKLHRIQTSCSYSSLQHYLHGPNPHCPRNDRPRRPIWIIIFIDIFPLFNRKFCDNPQKKCILGCGSVMITNAFDRDSIVRTTLPQWWHESIARTSAVHWLGQRFRRTIIVLIKIKDHYFIFRTPKN